MTRAEFIEKNKVVAKNENSNNRWLFLFLGVFAVFLFCVEEYGKNLSEFFRGPFLMLVFFGGFFGIIVFIARRSAKNRQELSLFCPHCKKALLGISFKIVVASGRCGRCGGIVLDDWNR
jgi:hypothetical protein